MMYRYCVDNIVCMYIDMRYYLAPGRLNRQPLKFMLVIFSPPST